MFADDPYSVIPLALLATCLLSAGGCSARIELERTNSTEAKAAKTSTAQSDRTTVQLDLQPRSPQPIPPRKSPSKPAAPPVSPPIISGNAFVFSYQAGDTYYHSETHVHIQQSPPPRVEERIPIHRDAEPNRQIDERCERLRTQHEERVKRWREFPGTMGR